MDLTHKLYNRFISTWLTRAFTARRITANQVTIFNFAFTLTFGVYFFSRGTVWGNWCGLIVCFANVLLDYLDGDLAIRQKTISPLGFWLDTTGDIFLQNSIMAAICFGIFQKVATPLLLAAILLYFICNSFTNVLSLQYNNSFGFDSYKGSTLFRKYMDTKPTLFNKVMKNILDPTSSWVGIVLFTVRYWIILGVLFNKMLPAFVYIAGFTIFRCIAMTALYGLHLNHYKKLWVSQALAILDRDREEYWKCRTK